MQPPPTFQNLLLENPYPVVIALVATGLVLGWAGKQRGDRRLARATWIALPLAGAVYALATFVETGREHVLAKTHELVHSSSPLNLAAVDAILLPETVLTGPNGEVWLKYQDIRKQLERVVKHHHVAEHTFRTIGAETHANGRALSAFDLRTRLSGSNAGLPIQSKWTLVWKQQDDGRWRVTEIQWREFMKHPPRKGMWR